MKLRSLTALAAGVGLWLGGMAAAESPKHAAKPSNQALANTVATTLERSGNLNGRTVDITATDGVVELFGKVTDSAQHDAVITTVLAVPGVKSVVDSLATTGFAAIRPAQALTELPTAAPPGGAALLPAPTASPVVDPLPLGQPGGNPYDLSPPRLPPHAWPTYAPYNNVSRVAYPNNYPYNAWPFIGPFYPFPKVPMGWRSVTLEWQDGHWWMGRNATKYDYWRVRYW